MFIAHAPAGYLVAKFVDKKISKSQSETRLILACGIFFSILPDLDMIYFYTIDNRQNLHHSYWTHIPIFWIACSLSIIFISRMFRSRTTFICGIMMILATMVHLMLDSIAGGILWLYPLNAAAFTLVDVPAQFSYWILNFLFHWTFLLELEILMMAAIVLFRRDGLQKASTGDAKA